jgi:hypothetical protein
MFAADVIMQRSTRQSWQPHNTWIRTSTEGTLHHHGGIVPKPSHTALYQQTECGSTFPLFFVLQSIPGVMAIRLICPQAPILASDHQPTLDILQLLCLNAASSTIMTVRAQALVTLHNDPFPASGLIANVFPKGDLVPGIDGKIEQGLEAFTMVLVTLVLKIGGLKQRTLSRPTYCADEELHSVRLSRLHGTLPSLQLIFKTVILCAARSRGRQL